MRRIIGIILAISVISVVSGVAEEKDSIASEWKFTGERLPTHDKLNTAGPKYSDIGCEKWPDTLYENYIELNPEFHPFSSKTKWREKWRRSLVLNSDKNWDTFNHCLYRMLRKQMMERTNKGPRQILFCGVIANGINGNELKSAKAAEELFEYGMDKRFSAFHTLLNREYRSSPIKFNLDVKYYLQLMIKKHWPKGNRLHVTVERYLEPDASKALALERRKFVEDAFGRGDYKAVLATTKPCA